LIDLLRSTTLENKQKEFVNAAVTEIKRGLKLHTAVTQVADVDLYEVSMDAKRVERFTEIANSLKQRSVIFEETIQGFRIEATKRAFRGPGEIKDASGEKTAFSQAFAIYDNPYDYLQELLSNESLTRSELYKLFTKISYRILNKDGYEISGGERSEFRLLQEISDAQNFEILMVDEPESSFDNMFLKSDVCKLLKAISETMPVVVVTHNSTVGASVGADYLLFARKEVENGEAIYRIYSGHPTDKSLSTVDGKSIGSHETMMDSLEAGAETYEDRRQGYEAVKN
jgi:ABC-type lipopolysaccharide export system ATPase subunit